MAGRQIRRGTAAERNALGGLAAGELGFETDTEDVYIGAAAGDELISDKSARDFLNGQDQAVKTTSGPRFAGVTISKFKGLSLETLTAPVAAIATLVTGSGNVDAGTHSYRVAFVTALGTTELGLESNVVTTDVGHGQISLSNIPLGAAGDGVTARQIYRTKAGGTTWWLVAEVGNNTATTYVDNIADVALTIRADWLENFTGGLFYRDGARAGLIGVVSTLFGLTAGHDLTTGALTAFGRGAGYKNTTGHSTCMGDNAGWANTTGYVTAIGDSAGMSSVNVESTFVGFYAGQFSTAPVTCVGHMAGYVNTTGTITAIGLKAAFANIDGDVVAVGQQAAYAVQHAVGVTAIGNSCLLKNTTGLSTAVGFEAGRENLTGHILAIGYGAAHLSTVSITAIGYCAGLVHTTGIKNTIIGYESGVALTTGHSNTLVGHMAGWTGITIEGSVFIGKEAGYWETGNNKLFIDNGQRASEADARIKALVYGVFDAATANQWLRVNGHFGILLSEVPACANNAAAQAAGLAVGDFYRTNADPSVLCIRSA